MKARWLIATAVVALLVGGIGTAGAKRLLTGNDIQDGSLTARDIKKGGISLNRLSEGTQRLLHTSNAASFTGQSQSPAAAGAKGEKGDKGDIGPQGLKGDTGATGASGADADAPRLVDANHLNGFTPAPKGDNGDATDNGTIGFDTPPAAPTLGTKSLHLHSTNGKPVVVYLPLPSGYDGVNGPRPLLGELTKASYGSLIHTQPQPALDVSFQIEVFKSAATHFGNGYTTVVYEPYQNGSPDTADQWHRHSVDEGKVWSTQALPSGNCTQANPCPFRVFREENPNAEVIDAKLRIGQNSGLGWAGFDGYVDDLSFGFGPVTRYDLGK
jgi:hypothetical protein